MSSYKQNKTLHYLTYVERAREQTNIIHPDKRWAQVILTSLMALQHLFKSLKCTTIFICYLIFAGKRFKSTKKSQF